MEFVWTSISDVEPDDSRLRLSFGRDARALAESISRNGVLTPVIVWGRRIVSGFLRIESSGGDKFPAMRRAFDSDAQALEAAYAENAFGRRFNEIEKALVLTKFRDIAGMEARALADRFAEPLRFQRGTQVVENFFRLLELPRKIQTAIARSEISAASAFAALHFPVGARDAFLSRAAIPLRLSPSDAREAAGWIEEIAERDGMTVEAVLDRLPLTRADEFRAGLRGRRFPRLTEKAVSFASIVSSCALGDDVRVEPPRHFEGAHVQVSFTARGVADLKTKIEKLRQSVESGRAGALFSNLQSE